MENITIDLTITSDQIISAIGILVTIVIATIGGIYAIITNTKKYELTENYRKELLDWYSVTVGIMIAIIHHVESGEFFEQSFTPKRAELLSRLSTQTEIGRFYCPNVIKKDGFGNRKPSAYQGYRHINLEFLLYFYNIASDSKSNESIRKLWDMERHFTSMIFDTIEPRKRNKLYSKYTEITIPAGRSIEDYIRENPEKISVFSQRRPWL